MNPAKPAAHLPRKPGRRRYVSATSERILRDLFDGWIPAVVIEDALRHYAVHLGKLDPATRRKVP